LADVVVCGRCGARSWAGTQFCYVCGQSLTPNGQGVVSPGQPPTPFAPVPPAVPVPPAGYNAGPPPTGAARPIGIVILTIVEIVVGVGGLFVAADLLRWAIVSNYYQEAESTVDLVMGLAYLALPIPAFVIAWGLWSRRSWAPMAACLLSIILLGFEVLGVFEWGVETTDVLGAIVNLSVLAYLNTNSVRAFFGRSPTAFLQGPR
jgi:uncharacterized membrane protein (DUF2068 family)